MIRLKCKKNDTHKNTIFYKSTPILFAWGAQIVIKEVPISTPIYILLAIIGS
jgi:hypothetical protein